MVSERISHHSKAKKLGQVQLKRKVRFQIWMIIGAQQSSIFGWFDWSHQIHPKWMFFDRFLYRETEWQNKHLKLDEIDHPILDGKHLHPKLDDIDRPDLDESNSC